MKVLMVNVNDNRIGEIFNCSVKKTQARWQGQACQACFGDLQEMKYMN